MRTRWIIVTTVVLLGGLSMAAPAHAEVQLGDLLKKVTGKESKEKEQNKDKSKAQVQDTIKADKRGDRPAESASGKTGRPAAKDERKVDSFIDQNHDGVDDRRQSKVRRGDPRQAPAESPAAPAKASPRAQPDTSKGKPPR